MDWEKARDSFKADLKKSLLTWDETITMSQEELDRLSPYLDTIVE